MPIKNNKFASGSSTLEDDNVSHNLTQTQKNGTNKTTNDNSNNPFYEPSDSNGNNKPKNTNNDNQKTNINPFAGDQSNMMSDAELSNAINKPITFDYNTVNVKDPEALRIIKSLEQQLINMDNKYKSIINVMQVKLNAERSKNNELQGQISDLQKENQNLRKSKIDLMTWANTEIKTLNKKNEKYKQKLNELQTKAPEGTADT